MYPNVQAYDRGVMFNPDGRLFQVEYAKEAIKKGATSIGMAVNDGIVFVAHKNITDPLTVPNTIQKVFRIDSHIGATYSGINADGLHLVNMARSITQNHRLIYGEVKSVEALTKEISNYMMQATQYGGIRPYGVSVLIGGVDTGPKLFELDPGASFQGYMADAIGIGKKTATEILLKEYKEKMSIDEAIDLGVKIVKKINEGKLTNENMDIGLMQVGKEFVMLTGDQLAQRL